MGDSTVVSFYLAFTSRPTSLSATNKAYVIFFVVCMFSSSKLTSSA